jgi:hypothetical protein
MANPLIVLIKDLRLPNMSSVYDRSERHCAGFQALPLNAVVCRPKDLAIVRTWASGSTDEEVFGLARPVPS